jgi:ribonuclease-3
MSLKLDRQSKKNLKKNIKGVIGYSPNKLKYYYKAFVHKSTYHELDGRRIYNERLEFLGDSVLDTVIAEYLFKKLPHKNEGVLSKLRSKIVCRENLNKIAINKGLDQLMFYKVNNTSHVNLYGNALEALIGAIYLDKGFKKARSFVIQHILLPYHNIEKMLSDDTDYKSQLIEWGQKNNTEVMFKNTEKDKNKFNEITFNSKVYIKEELWGEGEGKSKKEAEQNAAGQVICKMENMNPGK